MNGFKKKVVCELEIMCIWHFPSTYKAINPISAPQKLDKSLTCIYKTQYMKTRGSDIQGHAQLHNESEATRNT